MFKQLSGYIRRRETRLARILYRVAKGVQAFNVPVIRPLHAGLYNFHIGMVVGLRWIKQKFYFEPMFKARCASCGRGLTIDNGLPMISSHLQLRIGDNVYIAGENGFVAPAIHHRPTLHIGDHTTIGNGTNITVAKSVTVGSRCLIGRRVYIGDSNGHPLNPENRHEKVTDKEIEEVIIGDNVWIGNGVYIGPGVQIGSGSAIAANSVVTKSVPANSVVMGSPARVVRNLAPDSVDTGAGESGDTIHRSAGA